MVYAKNSNTKLAPSRFFIYFLGLIIQEVSFCNCIKGPIGIYLSSISVARNLFFFCFPIISLGYAISKTNYDGTHQLKEIILILVLVLVACESYAKYNFVAYKSIDALLMTPIAAALLFISKIWVLLLTSITNWCRHFLRPFILDIGLFYYFCKTWVFMQIIVTILSLILVFLHRWVKFILYN